MNREELTRMLLKHEDMKLELYRCPAGKLTIGVGRNLEDVGISTKEALFLLENDVERVCAELDRAIPWWRDLDDVRQNVLAEMCFNLGLSRFLMFKKTLGHAQAGNFPMAAAEMKASKWAAQVGGRAVTLAKMMELGNWPK